MAFKSRSISIAIALFAGAVGCASIETGPPPLRVSPKMIRSKLQSGNPALLVCAYDAKECRGTHLEGGITLEDLKSRLESLPKDAEIYFVCG